MNLQCHSQENNNINKRQIISAVVDIGDRVLVKILAWDGKHRLSDKWEEDVYIVTRQPNSGIPVFEVKK